MAKLNTNSNAYIVIYAAILVIVVAFLLSFVSSSLRERQESNVTNDVKSKILAALHVETDDPEAAYESIITDNLWDGTGLQPVPAEEFKTDYNPEIKAGRYHVFVAQIDGETKYVLPVYGMGLWGPIWGYIALNADRQTVFGAHFDHEGETAGLGAEIKDSKAWQAKFEGKKIADEGKVILGVKKAADGPDPTCEVDAVTGATLTSAGVDAMLKSGLEHYLSFVDAADETNANTNEKEEGEE